MDLDIRMGLEPSMLWERPERVEQEGEEERVDDSKGSDIEKSEDEERWEALSVDEQLTVVCSYLRNQHFYCLFCGHQYDSSQQVLEECPGETEDDHD